MSGRRRLRRVLALALVTVAGIVGMLLVEGIRDVPFFALAALPLAVGAWRAIRLRGDTPRDTGVLPDEAAGDG